MLKEAFFERDWHSDIPRKDVGVILDYLDQRLKHLPIKIQPNILLSSFRNDTSQGVYICLSRSPGWLKTPLAKMLQIGVKRKMRRMGYKRNGLKNSISRNGITAQPRVSISHLGLTLFLG